MYNTYRFLTKLWSGEAGKKLKNRHCQQNYAALKKPKSTSNFVFNHPHNSDSLEPVWVVRSYPNMWMIEKN